jgi:hypothetical protein
MKQARISDGNVIKIFDKTEIEVISSGLPQTS